MVYSTVIVAWYAYRSNRSRQEEGISKAGELEALSEIAGAFVEADLKANLLSDWNEV